MTGPARRLSEAAEAVAPSATPRRRPPLFVLVAISALQPFALNVLAPVTPALALALSTDYATVQLTLSVYLVAVAATQLVVGPISDRFGRRPCILAGLAFFVAGSLLGAAATSIESLIAARVVQAIGGGTCFALSRAVVRDTASRNEAASLIGYITMAMVVSPMIAPLAGGLLGAQFGWRSIFLATALLALLAGLPTWLRLSETVPAGAASSVRDIARGFPLLVGDRVFLGYALSLSFSTAAFFGFIAGAPYVVQEVMGHGPEVYGIYFLGNAGGYMAGNFLTGRFGQRIGSQRLVWLGTLVSLVSTAVAAVLAFVEPWTPAALFLPLVVNAVGNGLTIPGGTASALSVRPELAGTAAGITGAAQLGLGALVAVLVGHGVTIWPPFVIVAMLACAIAALAAFRLARTREQG